MNSKYYKTWKESKKLYPEMDEKEEAVAAPRLQSYEEQIFGFIMFLCF